KEPLLPPRYIGLPQPPMCETGRGADRSVGPRSREHVTNRASATSNRMPGTMPGPGPTPRNIDGLTAGTGFATSDAQRPPPAMIIDRETFTELAVHLKLASDAVLTTAKHLAVLSNGNAAPDEHWAGTLDGLMNMNTEITLMERILRALMEANREE